MKKALIPLLLLFVGTCFGMILTRLYSKPKEIVTEIVKTDTLTIARVDTIRIEKPVPYKVIIRDTIYIRDTVGVTLLQEVKEYKDSTYYAKISGINAFLEEIKVYPKTTTKYVYKEKKVVENVKKWAFYINSEYCFTSAQQYLPIGAKLQYNGAKAEYYIKGGGDLILNESYVALGANIPLVKF